MGASPDTVRALQNELHDLAENLPLHVKDFVRRDQPLLIRVFADWHCYPLWVSGQGIYTDAGGHELGLSEALIADLEAWMEDYDAGFDDSYPPDSVVPYGHSERGWRLAKRVRKELPPAWTVTGRDPVTYKEVEMPLRRKWRLLRTT